MPFPVNFLPLIFDDLPGTGFFDPSHLHISFEVPSRQDITDMTQYTQFFFIKNLGRALGYRFFVELVILG